jgi:hypothetical protein
MNKTVSKNSTLILILPILIVLASCKKDSKKVYSELFESGKISTTAVEYSPSFSANGTELYFAKSNDPWGKGKLKSSIYFSEKKITNGLSLNNFHFQAPTMIVIRTLQTVEKHFILFQKDLQKTVR